MRIARFALVGALLLGASACQTDDGGGVNANIPPLAFVRYINAVPDTFNLTVRWVDQIDFTPMTFVNVPYRGMGQGGYQGLEAGSRHFRVFTYDPIISGTNTTGGATTAQMADTTFDFQAGQYYTILHLGYARTGQTPAQRVYILNDAVPASNGQVQVRLLHAGIGAGAVDAFATADQFTPLAGAPAIANVGYNTSSAFISRASGAFAMQLAATGTTASIMGTSATAGVAGTATADPIAGATVNGSVLTALALPPATRPSPAANYTQVEATGRSIDSVAAVTTDTFEVRGTAANSWAVNRFARTANSFWTLTQTPPACPTVTAPSVIRCQTRPAARTDTVVSNTATNVTIRSTNSQANYRSAQFRDTVDLAVGTARVVDTIYTVVGGFELRDSTASWTAGAFNARTDTTWTITLTPSACTASPGAGWTVGCSTRPAVRRFRITTNAAGTAQTAEDLTAYQQAWYTDTLRNPGAVGGPVTVIVRSPNTRMQVTREIARPVVRSTFSITGNNPPAIHWFADRQPPRTTTP